MKIVRRLGRRPVGAAALMCVLAMGLVMPAQGAPVLTGGSGGTVFGVSSYGLPVPGVPTYIPNNLTGRIDVLSSPGGTFLTANPVVANNISEFPPGLPGVTAPFPYFAFQVGGGNGNGPFGSAAVLNTGTQVGFALQDPVAGGGSASYSITSWSATFTDPVGSAGFGTFLAIAGQLPAVGSAAVAALRTFVTSANPLSPFFGGFDLPQLVLALARTGPTEYSFVALGGFGGVNAAMVVTNGLLGTFQGLAINNLAMAIPAGDVFTATSTLTVYADPAAIESIFPDLSLINLTGTSLPENALVGITAVPEPGTWALMGFSWIGLAAGLGVRRRRARSRLQAAA